MTNTELTRLLDYFETELVKKRTQVHSGHRFVAASDVGMYATLVAYLREQEAALAVSEREDAAALMDRIQPVAKEGDI